MGDPGRRQRINGPPDHIPIHNARPASNHPGGVNVAFCDGHTRFVSEKIDYGVWSKLMTPDDANCHAPGDIGLTPAGKTNNHDYLRSSAIDETAIEY